MKLEGLFSVASKMYRIVRPVRSESYKAFVRSFPCIACGTKRKRREAMHIGPHGLGQKASDLDTLPGCWNCHRELHHIGRVKFEAKYALSFWDAIEALQMMYVIRYGKLPEAEQKGRAA